MNALFGDGFIKYSAYPLGNFLASNKRGLKLLAVQERLVPNSLDEMTLKPGLYSFDEMVSKNVPDIIYVHVKEFMIDLCNRRYRFRRRETESRLCDPSRRPRNCKQSPRSARSQREQDVGQPGHSRSARQYGLRDRPLYVAKNRGNGRNSHRCENRQRGFRPGSDRDRRGV